MRRSRGMVLIIVVVVIFMISLAGLSFVTMMNVEYKAVQFDGDELQLQQIAGSGTEFLKVFLDRSRREQDEAGGTWNNPELFRGVPAYEDLQTRRRGRFSLLSPRTGEETAERARFGLDNESARLNLAMLLAWDAARPGAGREALMNLPGMTESIADSILDWIDVDSTPRQFGAEADYYQGLQLPYSPRNGVPQCLEELLLVRGMSRDLLFGPDGLPSRASDARPSGRAEMRRGSGAQRTTVPWASLLTVCSAERNRGYAGDWRIRVNDANLGDLYRRLGQKVDPSWARFIVAYRQLGPYEGTEATASDQSLSIDPSAPARFRIASVLDLVGARIRVPSPDGRSGRVVASPLSTDPAAMREYLPKLMDGVTSFDGAVIRGRVNVNLAPREVLRAIPGLDRATVEQIVAARGNRNSVEDSNRRYATWLLTERVVDLARMRKLEPYLTAGGDVYRRNWRVIMMMAGNRSALRWWSMPPIHRPAWCIGRTFASWAPITRRRCWVPRRIPDDISPQPTNERTSGFPA